MTTINFPLKPHQVEGVAFFHANKGRCLNCDDPGLGKTIISLAYAHQSSGFPLVAVCPATVKGTWKSEAKKWLGDISVHTMEGKSPEPIPRDAKIVVTSYNLLDSRIDDLLNFPGKTLVFDECHNLANRQTATTKAATRISRKYKQVIGLSGTPISNRPKDFWPILHIIRPAEYPNFTAYGWRYCGAEYKPWGWQFDGASNLDQLAEEIKPFVIRRTIDILAEEMPERNIRMELLDIDNREEYQEARLHFRRWMESKGKTLNKNSIKAEKLIQVSFLLRLAAKLKCRNLIRFIRDYREQYPERKILLFCTHNNLQDVLQRRAFRPDEPFLAIHGGIPTNKRHPIIERFQDDPECRMIVVKTRSAGAGITLTAAETSIFCELPWSASSFKQAAARNFRIGQKKEVDCIITAARDTIEHKVCQVLQDKQSLHDLLIDGTSKNSLPLMDLLLSTVQHETKGLLK